jgi:hypothetical protein
VTSSGKQPPAPLRAPAAPAVAPPRPALPASPPLPILPESSFLAASLLSAEPESSLQPAAHEIRMVKPVCVSLRCMIGARLECSVVSFEPQLTFRHRSDAAIYFDDALRKMLGEEIFDH